jgi:hypothetical protein
MLFSAGFRWFGRCAVLFAGVSVSASIGASIGANAESNAGANGRPELGLPIRCEVGRTCWITNYVDLDPGKGVRDHSCAAFGYDGHKGTDFAIRDLKAMADGVVVIASAPGTVRGVRDGMEDVDVNVIGRQSINGRECGNGIVIAHGQGWETQYCHLRKGSISVKAGQVVGRGDPLGMVGHSGLAEFPHVHLSVRHKKTVIDPFNGNSPAEGCGKGKRTLWQANAANKINLSPSVIFNAGFAAKAPRDGAVRRGLFKDKVLSRSAPALVMWAELYWPLKGDRLLIRIFDPDGKLMFEHQNKVGKTQARWFAFAGKKRKSLFWPPGEYRGEVSLFRNSGTGEILTTKEIRRVTIK